MLADPTVVLAVGVDPGLHSGVALVEWRGPSARPGVVVAVPVSGSTELLYWRRATSAMDRVVEAIEARQVQVAGIPAWMEEPPPVAVRGSVEGDRMGLRTWAGIGRRQGMLQAAWLQTTLGRSTLARRDQGDWAQVLGRRRAAPTKWGDHQHRLREAQLNLEGASEPLDAAPESCQVDLAEAMLIGLAALLDARGLRAYPDRRLPSEQRRHVAALKRGAS